MLEFHKAKFLALHIPFCTLMTFLMMLFVILLPMLMIRLSPLNVIRYMICNNRQNWLLNFSLIYETLCTGVGLLISIFEKLNWFYLAGLITLVPLMQKQIGVLLRKNHLLRCWSALTLSLLLKLPLLPLQNCTGFPCGYCLSVLAENF